MKIAILGFGREGQSVLHFIKTVPKFRGAEVWVLDKSERTKVPKGIRTQLGKKYLAGLAKFDVVFRSPGIPYNLPALIQVRHHGVKFSSLMHLFFENCRAKVIGVTGTKGKGTTSTLLYKMLKAAGRSAYLAGNVGTAALEILPKLKKNSIVILELSSFQLQDLNMSPAIAVVLDIFPDHQENVKTAEHGTHTSLSEYFSAKANIARFQKPSDKTFFFARHPMSRKIAHYGRGKKIAVDETRFRLFSPRDLKMPGYHNFKNAVMAATVAKAVGVPSATIAKTAKNFSGNEHRLEFVRKIGKILFYNDSASTNPETAAAAVRAFPRHARILIAGGKDKGLNYAPLAKAANEPGVKLVVLIGESRKKMQRLIKRHATAPDLGAAVRIAYGAAKKTGGPAVVLFSPGASSFDMFKNYADRGERFKHIIKTLK